MFNSINDKTLIKNIILIIIAVVLGLSLISHNMGLLGYVLSRTLFYVFGFAAYALPILILFLVYLNLKKSDNILSKNKYIILTLFFLIFLLSIEIYLDTDNISLQNRISKNIILSKDGLGSGMIGSLLGFICISLLGSTGSYLFILLTVIAILLYFIDFKIQLDFLNKIINKIRSLKLLNKKQDNQNEKKFVSENTIVSEYDISKLQEKSITDIKNDTKTTVTENNSSLINKNTEYIFPDLNILEKNKKPLNLDKKNINDKAKIINNTMNNFNINAKVTNINQGPTVTSYELSIKPGTKVSKILNLSDDLSLALATTNLRMQAPIPGKSAIGIEIPNDIKEPVLLRDILEENTFSSIVDEVPLVLGKDISGISKISSIEKMPHLLIAGATGSGKSVCINSIIISILYTAPPEAVKLLLIDPKVVELSIYNGIPHLLFPVITDPKDATISLKWAVIEMERRYKLFADIGVRDIKGYNKKMNKKSYLEKIIIIIDELADLMIVSPKEMEEYISRLAQMARAAGMYLIIATQRPSVDVITGTIKANIPSRISFAVSSQIDSRTILDMVGAEKLLGQGDMLFFPSSYSKPIRIQGAFIDDHTVSNVIEDIKRKNIDLNFEKIQFKDLKEEIKTKSNQKRDELYNEALALISEDEQASISFLQRKLSIGYNRAAKIIDDLESDGYIGPNKGNKPRDIYFNKFR